MTGRFSVESGKAVITYNGRTVSTTDGTLVCVLPTQQAFTRRVTFPDFAKDYYYHWEFEENVVNDGRPNPYQINNSAQVFFTVKPQEYSSKQTLMSVPTGTDFFIGKVGIGRATAPLSTWMGLTIDCLVPQYVYMPWRGSAVVEQMLNMSRAIHVYMESSNLVLEIEQSIGPAPGGYGSYGDSAPGALVNRSGHIESYGSVAGMPVWTSTSSPYRKQYSDSGSDYHGLAWDNCKVGKSNAATTTDPTWYGSTYDVYITGRFGRRS